MSYQTKELLLPDGGSPFAEWFGSLEAVAAAKVRVAVSRMEQGNLSNGRLQAPQGIHLKKRKVTWH